MAERVYASIVLLLISLLIPAARCQPVQPRIASPTALTLALTPSAAQRPSPSVQASEDDAEIQACTLTMGTITRMMQAEELLLLKPDADHREHDYDRKAEQSVDKQTSALAERPEIVAVLGKYDFTPRTYTVTFYAYLSAGIAAAELDAGASLKGSAIKAHVNPANVSLVRAHKKETDELMQKYLFPHW